MSTASPGVDDSHAKTRSLRTLSWTSSTYFAEGLPWSVLHQIASEYLTAIGMRPAQVGYTSLLHATTSLKFVWSPIVDLFGSLRRWMIFMQALMGVCVGGLALVAHRVAERVDPAARDPTWVWVILVVIGVLSATHDIACDGYYMEALDKNDQARYSGARVAAFRAAMLLGSAGLVFVGGSVNWLVGFGLAGAILLALALAHQRWLPQPAHGTHGTDSHGADARAGKRRGLSHVMQAYKTFLFQDQVVWVIAFLLTYKMADVLMFSMSKVLLARELGVPTDLRGVLNAFSIGASIVGAIVGGAWIARSSLKAALFPITLLMAVTEPLFVLLAACAPALQISVPGSVDTIAGLDFALAWPRTLAIGAVIVTEQLCGGMATAAQMVFIMRRCDPAHRAAHFAFATAVYSTAQMLVGAYSGRLYEDLGSVDYFWVVSVLTLPAVLLSRRVPTE